VANAVLDALAPFGIEHLDTPLEPQRIWQALGGDASPEGAPR
jgi:carbon-monoxide dehydrogenase large subunit